MLLSPSTNGQRQRVGIFTGGGTAPGWNAVLASAARILKDLGHEAIGIPEGWKGLLSVREDIVDLTSMTRRQLHDLISKGGSILRSSRTKISEKDYEKVAAVVKEYGLTGIIPIGGDDTLGQARELQKAGIVRAVGVPKTIDNDVFGTDKTFGFDTACDRTAGFMRRMRVDAEAHSRVAIVETMGRDAGWIALHGGEAGGADITLIPEFQISEEDLMARIREVYNEKDAAGRAARCAVIAISEGYFGADEGAELDAFGHPKLSGAANKLAGMVKNRLKLGTQTQVIGYETRNGDPVASDVDFASKLGAYAGFLASEDMYGNMASLRNGAITHVPLSEVRGGRFVTPDLYDVVTMTMRSVPKNIMDLIRNIRKKSGAIPWEMPL